MAALLTAKCDGDCWVDSIPIDNLVGAVSGLFAVVAGAAGLGFCCESAQKTSRSCSVQTIVAMHILGCVASPFACIVNINSFLFLFPIWMAAEGKSTNVVPLWDPLLTNPNIVPDLFAEGNYGAVITVMLATSAFFNFVNFFLQFCGMIFVCRGVSGYNDCTCCCVCCLGANQLDHSNDGTAAQSNTAYTDDTVDDNKSNLDEKASVKAAEYGEYDPEVQKQEPEPVKSEPVESAVESNAVPTSDCAEVKNDIIESEVNGEEEKKEEVTGAVEPVAVDSTVTDSKTETQSISEMLDTTDEGRNKTQNPYEVELPAPDY